MPSSDHSRHRLSRLDADRRPATADADRPQASPVGVGLSPPAAHGWRERWLPARWRGARLDPGRHGALALAGVAALAAAIAAVGVWRDRPVAQPAPPVPAVALAPVKATEAAPPSSPGGPAATPKPLVISVAGKVRSPGLVTVAPGARIADALAAAGGVAPGTDLLALNLAQPLTDGQQILVGVTPPPGAAPVTGGTAAPSGGTAAAASASGDKPGGGPVNLNTATATELESLPGVGPVMAKAILDWRTKNGNFRSIDQLSEVNGIGPSRLTRLRDLVTV